MLQATQLEALVRAYGFEMVTLASSNSFSYSKQTVSLRAYVEQHMQPQTAAALANETWYLFGDTRGGRWEQASAHVLRALPPFSRCAQLLQLLPPAPMDGELEQPAATFGLGGCMSGVSFHTHGAVFAEVRPAAAARAQQCRHASAQLLHGEKLWFMSPPSTRPAFDGDVTQMQAPIPPPPPPPPPPHACPLTVQWLLQYAELGLPSHSSAQDVALRLQGQAAAPTLRQQPDALLSCMLLPGHVLYLPPHWWHATLNIAPYNFFTSYFIQEERR